MCVIIDASVAADAFAVPPTFDAQYVIKWIEKGGTVVYGGKLTQELYQINSARKLLAQYVRAGRAKTIANAAIDAEVAKVVATGPASNDTHILGLARASGARLLYSRDELLIQDFKDRRFISSPKGKVYKSAGNRDLLQRTPKTC